MKSPVTVNKVAPINDPLPTDRSEVPSDSSENKINLGVNRLIAIGYEPWRARWASDWHNWGKDF